MLYEKPFIFINPHQTLKPLQGIRHIIFIYSEPAIPEEGSWPLYLYEGSYFFPREPASNILIKFCIDLMDF